MNSIIVENIVKFVGFLFFQVLILKGVNIGGNSFNYILLFIYPLFIILLPLRTTKIALLFISFFLGITLDIFYNSPGVHAGACVFSAFFRPFLLNILTPRGGYNVSYGLIPSKYGFTWFFRYAGILLFIHLLAYFILLLFSPVFIGEILLRTISSFIFSMLLVVIYIRIFPYSN